jgi:CBS domain-containing protein
VTIAAQKLVLEQLLPMARAGLEAGGIDSADIDLYLGVMQERVASGQTGSQWLLESLETMRDEGSTGEHANALVAAMLSRQAGGRPIHEWPVARLSEGGGWKHSFMRVEQFMTTDLFTVHADDPIELVANLMQWQKIRHVPVEDSQHRLVGLISYRTLLKLMAAGRMNATGDSGIAVSDVMTKNPVTATPEMETLEATRLMKQHNVGCLPVVKDGRLVGIITERDFMTIARELMEQQLRE